MTFRVMLGLLLLFLTHSVSASAPISIEVGGTAIQFPAIKGYEALSQQSPAVSRRLIAIYNTDIRHSYSKPTRMIEQGSFAKEAAFYNSGVPQAREFFVPGSLLPTIKAEGLRAEFYLSPPYIVVLGQTNTAGSVSPDNWMEEFRPSTGDNPPFHMSEPDKAFLLKAMQRHVTPDHQGSIQTITEEEAGQTYHDIPTSYRTNFWLTSHYLDAKGLDKKAYGLETVVIALLNNTLITLKAYGISDSPTSLQQLDAQMSNLVKQLTEQNPNRTWLWPSWQNWGWSQLLVFLLAAFAIFQFISRRTN